MTAIAISGTSPLSMLGGVMPMRGARGVPSFVSAFNSKTSGSTITAAATNANATSQQIADGIIRSMLGSPASVSTDVKNGAQSPANNNPPAQDNQPASPAGTPTTGDALLRSMLGSQSAPLDATIQAAIPNPPAVQAPNQAASPQLNPTPQAPQKNRQSAAPAMARPALVSLPDAAPATTQVFVVRSDAPPAAVSNMTQPAGAAASETQAVDPAAAQAKGSDTAAPLAFSAELTPILQEQPAASQTRNLATPMAAGENQKAPVVAPEQRASGNGAGRDDRSPERDAQESLKNEIPARAMQASAGAGDFSRGWTTSIAPVASENPTETPAGPPGEPVRTGQGADAATQLAETNSPVLKSFQSPAVQEIAVRIERGDMAPVDLHVTERAGEIHVAVRTADAELQTSLRQDLSSLSNSLERAGYHAETFVPRAAAGSQTNLREERQAQQGFSGRGGSQGESGSGKQKGQREQRGASWLQELEQSK